MSYLVQDKHHQRKLQLVPTSSASEFFALNDDRKNTTSASCRESRPSWALEEAGCTTNCSLHKGTPCFISDGTLLECSGMRANVPKYVTMAIHWYSIQPQALILWPGHLFHCRSDLPLPREPHLDPLQCCQSQAGPPSQVTVPP